MSQLSWKEKLGNRIPDALHQEIDAFEAQMELRKKGELGDRLFMEARLRRGVYGQRYDNGQRHDGEQTRTLDFPCGDATKGPSTVWDAPGMQRIKIPFGKVTPEQLDVLAEVAEEYSDAILHVTTRQDIQLHFVHIEDTPDMMRRLAAVGITTREACGNSVRNITACPYAGVCHDQSFDVSPYAHAFTQYFLGHPDIQDFGRKFKVAFSGCKDHPCGLTNFHDLGAIAVTREVNGERKRGFELYVGGGLGAIPQHARLLDEFVPEEELFPLSQAVCRVFARLGEKKNRARARIKFLVQKLGIEEFRRLVLEERKQLRPDPGWTAFLDDLHVVDERPLHEPGTLPEGPYPAGFETWLERNVREQPQQGYVVATVSLPMGDITSDQARELADLARKFTGDTVRTTVEQDLVFRWLSKKDLPAFYAELQRLHLAEAVNETIQNITACPGTDTCKLGISASRGLAQEVRRRLDVVQEELDPAVRSLRIKASGCFNACGQHHVSDLGFLGVSRNVKGRRVPHFQVVLGGQWTHNGGAYGLAIGAVPAKRIPEAIQRLTDHYAKEREEKESFQDFIKRTGKAQVRALLKDLMPVPAYEEDPSFYSDWGDPREYTIGDLGAGECAGEVVPFAQFGLEQSEREVFEAQEQLDAGSNGQAAKTAFAAMLTAAKALLRHRAVQVADDADDIVEHFRTHLHETKLFHDPYAGGKFAHYLFRTHSDHHQAQNGASLEHADAELAHRLIEEAQLFLEASHGCYDRMQGMSTPVDPTPRSTEASSKE